MRVVYSQFKEEESEIQGKPHLNWRGYHLEKLDKIKTSEWSPWRTEETTKTQVTEFLERNKQQWSESTSCHRFSLQAPEFWVEAQQGQLPAAGKPEEILVVLRGYGDKKLRVWSLIEKKVWRTELWAQAVCQTLQGNFRKLRSNAETHPSVILVLRKQGGIKFWPKKREGEFIIMKRGWNYYEVMLFHVNNGFFFPSH